MVRRVAMSRIYKSLPPKGTPLGIAFSGGLDTRCAVAWMSEQGMAVHAYTADLAQPDESNPADIPPIAMQHGAVAGQAHRLPRGHGARGDRRHPVRRLPPLHRGGKKYFNTTPLGRAVTTTAIVRAMREDGVNVFGDGCTHKGNDIQRFYRYGILVNPELQHLQALARPGLRDRLRRPQGDERVPGAARAALQDGHREGLLHRRQRARAPPTRPRTSSGSTPACSIVEPIMGVALWKPEVAIDAEEVTVDLRAGAAGRAQRPALRLARTSSSSRPTGSAAATASA